MFSLKNLPSRDTTRTRSALNPALRPGHEGPGDIAAQAGVPLQDVRGAPVVLDLQLFLPLAARSGT